LDDDLSRVPTFLLGQEEEDLSSIQSIRASKNNIPQMNDEVKAICGMSRL
jgi:hypothetical protein